MADNSFLFRRKPNKSTYKREDPDTRVTTLDADGKFVAVVLVKQNATAYTPIQFEPYTERGEALQRAHYINANYLLRGNVDPLPLYARQPDATLDELKQEGYRV